MSTRRKRALCFAPWPGGDAATALAAAECGHESTTPSPALFFFEFPASLDSVSFETTLAGQRSCKKASSPPLPHKFCPARADVVKSKIENVLFLVLPVTMLFLFWRLPIPLNRAVRGLASSHRLKLFRKQRANHAIESEAALRQARLPCIGVRFAAMP